jgi:superfamily II DNA or RNA helicase
VQSKGKRVTIIVHREELLEQVCRTLGEFGVKFGIIASGHAPRGCEVQVASVFTLVNRMHAYPRPDLVIVDEAHHASRASTWSRVFAHWHGSYVLGVTATPMRLDGKSLAGHFDEMVLGPTVAELMESGDLSRYTLYAPPLSIGKLRIRMGDYALTDLGLEMDKPHLVGDAVAHYQKLASGRRAVVFCVSLAHAANTERAFTSSGYRAARIDGGMERGERRALVQEFSKGTIKVLTSCDLISEGFDLPSIECAILMRPTMSKGLYLQQVGRALRVFRGKEKALILDHAGNSGRHGLPDDDQDWTLEEDNDSGKRKPLEKTLGLRLCGQCFACVKSGTMVCPQCGWEWPMESREVKETQGDLIAVTPDIQPKRSQDSIDRAREVGMAKTFQELKALAAERGYRPGWAAHIMKGRGGVR